MDEFKLGANYLSEKNYLSETNTEQFVCLRGINHLCINASAASFFSKFGHACKDSNVPPTPTKLLQGHILADQESAGV